MGNIYSREANTEWLCARSFTDIYHGREKITHHQTTRTPITLTSRSPTFNPGEDVASNLILIAILAVVLLFAGLGIYVIAKKVRMAAMKESATSKALTLKDIERDAALEYAQLRESEHLRG